MNNKAVDLGNYNIKTSDGLIFKATYETRKPENSLIQYETLEYNGTTYYISQGDFDQNLDKASKDTLPLFLYAITKKEHLHELNVVVGLPADQYNSNREKMSNKFKGEFKVVLNGNQHKTVLVNDVQVFPEGVGSFYTLSSQEKDGLVLIVDIGGRTVNICLFEDGKLVKVATVPHGVQSIFQRVLDTLKDQYGAMPWLTIGYIEKNYKKGIKIDGVSVDLGFIENEIEELTGEIYRTLHAKDFPIRLVDKMRLAGGGADLLKGSMEKQHHNVEVMANNIFANVNGFKEVANTLWRN